MFVVSYPWILYLLLRCIKNLWLREFFVEIVHRIFCRVTGLCCCSPVIWTWPWPLWWICQGQLPSADVQYPSWPHWSRYCMQWFKRFLFFTQQYNLSSYLLCKHLANLKLPGFALHNIRNIVFFLSIFYLIFLNRTSERWEKFDTILQQCLSLL